MAIFGNKRRKGVPRKKGKKRPPMSAATRKKISEALARRLGPTRGLDPYEKKGREPGKGNALPPNGVPGGGRRASEDFLVPDKIRKEPNYTTDLEDLKRKIIKDPKNGEKYLAKLKAAQKRAALDTGDNGRNRSNQRLAVRMQTLADDAGLHAKVTTTDKGKGKGKEKGTKPSFDDRRKQAVDKTKNALDSGKNALGLGDKPVDTTLTDGTVQNKRVQTRMNAGKFEVRQTGVAVGRDGQIHNVVRTETFDTQDEANKFARAAKKDHAGLTARDGSSDKQPIAATPKDTNKSKGTGKGEGADTTPQKKQRDPNRGKLTQAARATEQARKQAQQAQQAYDNAVKAHPNWDHKKELDAKHKADQAYQRAVNREEKLKAQRSGETYNAEKWNRATRDRRNRETQDETARADKAMTDYADQLERNQQQREKQADEKAAKKERAHQSRAKPKAAKEKRHAEIQAKKEKAKANRSRAQKQRRETERRNKATDARDLAALRKDQEEIRNAESDARDTAAMRKDLEDKRNAETDARDLAATRADLADMQAKEQAQEDADNWAELDAALDDDAMANYDPNEVMDALNGNTTPETEGDNDLNKVVADLAEKQQRLDAVRQTQLDNPATTYPRWDDNTPHNPEKYRQARENYQHLDDGELEDALTQAADTLKKYGIDLSNPVEPQTPMNGDPDNDIPNAELRALYGRAKAIDAELFERRAEQADMFHPEHMVDATGYEPTTHDPAYWQSLMTQYDLDNSPRAYVAAMDKQQLERMETMDIVAPEIRDAINERLDYMDPERPGGVFDNALAHETLRNIKKVVEANPNLAAIGYDDSTLMAMAAIHGNPRQAFRKHVSYLDEYEEWQAHLMHSMYGLNGGAVWGDVAVSAAAGEFDVERNKYTNFDVLVSNPLWAKQLEEETLNHIEDRIGYLPNVPNFIRYKQGKAPIPFSRDSWKEAAKEGGRRRTTKADKAARELQKANQQILKEKLKDLKATPLQPLAAQPVGLKTPLGTRGGRTALAFYDLKTSLGHEPTSDDYKRLVGGHAATLSDKDLKQAVRQAEQDARQNMGAREIVDAYNDALAARGKQAKTPKPSKAKPRVKTTKHTAKPKSFEDYKRESDKRQHATEMRDIAATLNPVREEQRTKRRKAAETAARMAKVDATLKKVEGEEWENYKHQSDVKQQAREIVDMVRVTTPIMKEHRAKQEAAEKAKATPSSMPKKKATAKVQEKATPPSRKPARQPVMNGNTSGETKRPKHAPKVTTTAAKPAETAPAPTPDGPRNRFAERLKKQEAELDTKTSPFAQREAKTLEEMQQRAQKRREQAQAAERRAQQAEEAAWGGTKLVPAEPMKAGARGARQRRDVNRAIASADKAVQARKDADKANERARASERALENRYNPQTVANRVKRLQADIRRNGDSDGTKADELAYWQNVHKQNVADGKIKEAAPKPAAKGKPKATRKRPQKVGEKLVENDTKEGETFNDGTITRNGIGITNAKQRGYKGYDFTVPGRNEPVSDYFIQGRGPQNLDDARVMADRIAEDLKLDGVDPNNLHLGRPNDEVTASAKYGWGEDQEHAKALMAARENKGKGSLDKANQRTQKSNRSYGANLPDNVNPFTGDKRPEGKLASTDEEKKLVEIANTHSFSAPKRREAIKKLEANGIKYRLAASQQRFDELTKLAEEYKPTKAELNPNNEGLFFNDLGAWLPPRRNGLASIKFEPGDKPVNYLLAIDGNQYNITNVHTQHNGVKVLSGIDLQTGKKWTMKTNNMGTIDRPYTLRERPDRGADLAPQFWHARKDLNDTYPYVDDKDINGWSESGLQAARDSVTRDIAEKLLPETWAIGRAPNVTRKDVDLYVKNRFKGEKLATSGTLDSLTTNEGSTLRELIRSNPTNSVYSPTMGEYLTQDSETNIVRDLAGLGDADNQQFANFKKSLLDDPDTRIIAGGDNGLTFMKPEKVEKFGYGYKITGTGDDGKRRVMKVQYDGYRNSIELWHPLRHEDGTAYTKEQAAQFATIKAQTEQARDLAQGNNDAAAVLYGASRLKELDAQRRKLHAQSGTQSTASEKVKKVQAEVDKLGVPDTAPKTKFGQRLQQQGAAMDAAKFDVTKVTPRDGEKAIRFEDLRPGSKGGSLTAKELDAVRAHAESLSNEDLIAAYGEARQQYNDAKGKGRVAGIRNAYGQEMVTRRLARGANNEMRPNHEPWPWGQGNEREEMRELRRTNLSEKERKDTESWLEGRAENLLNQMVANGKDRETARKELEEIRRNTKLDPFGKDTTQKVDTPTSPEKTAKKQQAKAAQAKAAQDKSEREKMRATRDSELTVNGRTFTPVEDVFFEDGQQAYNNKDEHAILKFMNEPGYWATTADGTQVFTADKVKFYKNYATISGKTPDGKKAQQKVSLISIGYPLRRKEVTATPKGETGTTPVKWARNDLQDGFNEDAEGYNINPNIDPQITRKIVNGEPRYYLNNQYGVIFTAIRNNTDFKVGQTLAGLIAADETSYPQIWVDKNGEGHAPRSIDPDARITIELVAARMARGKLPTQEDTPSVTREPKNKGVIPRYEGGYSRDELLATKQLKARGWTDTLIKKYLGDPDGTDVTGKYTTNLYSEDRAKQAEKLEPKLMANREKLRQKREDAIREQVNSGVNVFRKVGAKWAVQGNNLKEGEEVTVTKKNGATTTAYITRVFTHAGKEYGEIGKKPHGTKRNTSNGTKDTPTVSVDTQPATDRQIKYLLRLLDSHAADYGLNPGQNLMLDTSTVKFPTVEEVQKMSKSEVSYIIDLLLNDAM